MKGLLQRVLRWSVICVLTAPAIASGPEDLDALMALLAGVHSVRASYVETTHLSILEQRLTTRGTISYEAPDRITKQTELEPKQTVRFAGDELQVSSGDRVHRLAVADHPALEAFVVGLRATFAGDLGKLREFFHVRYRPVGDGWGLSLSPRDRALQNFFSEIEIRGRGRLVHAVDVRESNGDLRAMRLRVLEIQPTAGSEP
jgi:outer membrane lipoprotein-sorting protein